MTTPRFLLASLALALTAATATAQYDFDLEKRTPATLGAALDLDLVGAPPLALALVVPSTNSGPTPLTLIDPADLRSLAVGTDLLSAMAVVTTDAAGDASYSLTLPNTPSAAGFELHWQSLTLGGGSTFFGELSNPVVTLAGVAGTGVLAPATLAAARTLSALAVDGDNNVSGMDLLVTGGGDGSLTAATGLASTELYRFRTMDFVAGPTMSTPRALHTAIRLNDGRVLLIGGADQNGAVLASCEIYDPANNSITPTGSLNTPRILFGASLLHDGRVMVAGGTSTLQPDVTAAISAALRSVEIFDPATGTWSPAPQLGGYRLAPALTLLPNNQVMVSGGIDVTFFFGLPIVVNSTTAVQRWNPNSNSWVNGPNMSQARAGHQYNQVTLNDGRVLMSGGINVPSLLGANNSVPISGAELYDPASNSWQTANMPVARAMHSATVLPDGRVAVCGGTQGVLTAPVTIADVHLFDPSANTWSTAAPLSAPRAGHVAALLPDGLLVLVGGQGATNTLDSVETLRF
ncbi:MAG TPA: hypothetical protein ENI87_02520 [bacterium]|nr:hypothetical protein [bacterium]